MGCQEAAHLIPQSRPSFPRKRRRHSKVTFTLKFATKGSCKAEVTNVTHSTYTRDPQRWTPTTRTTTRCSRRYTGRG